MALQRLDALALLWGCHRAHTKVVDAAFGLWTRTVDLVAGETKGCCEGSCAKNLRILLLVLRSAHAGRSSGH
ncbi:hypothetical protein BGZ57DRAFT_159617 [Hyaloscypha finlandica]|nr:hypothetical protein BGZ57DRAFT_159617 [Hyaloscypha finlandica]